MNWVNFWWAVLAVLLIHLGWKISKLPPQRRWRVAVRECLVIVLCYVGMLGLLMFMERYLIFVPMPASESWQEPTGLNAEDVWLEAKTGETATRCHAWWCPVNEAKGTVLYCHGNAGNLSGRREQVREWQLLGYQVLIFDYPGYGRSEGAPDEAGCQAAGLAAYRWLVEKKQIPPGSLVLYGKSLGGGIAIELAATQPHRALVVFSTFTSIPDMAAKMLPFFPARWLVRTRFDNLDRIRLCRGPVFIGHGGADRLIPPDMGQTLFDAAAGPKKEIRFYPGIDHGPPPAAFFADVAGFLNSLSGPAGPS